MYNPFRCDCLPILISLPVVPHWAGTGTYAAGPVALVFDFCMVLCAGCFIHGIGAIPMLCKALDVQFFLFFRGTGADKICPQASSIFFYVLFDLRFFQTSALLFKIPLNIEAYVYGAIRYIMGFSLGKAMAEKKKLTKSKAHGTMAVKDRRNLW